MPHRTAKWLPIVLVGLLATATLAVPSQPAQADECLSAPKTATPAGSHWRYRVERGTKRHCWYLAAQRATPTAKAAVEPATSAPSRSVADARAEMIAYPAPAEVPSDSVWPAPEKPSSPARADASTATPANPTTTPSWNLASRWADTGASAADPEASSASVAASPAAPAVEPPTATTVADAAAPAPLSSQTMLIAGLVAALGVAGLIVRLVIGFAGSRPIIHREQGLHSRTIFDVEIPTMPPPPWLASPKASSASRAPAAEDDSGPPPLNWVRVARAHSKADHAGAAIEELLAKARPRRMA